MATMMGIALLKAASLLSLVFLSGSACWPLVLDRGARQVGRTVHAQRAAGDARPGLAERVGRPLDGARRLRRRDADLGNEFRHQVEEDIKPFRDVLLGLFFVTVGMMLDAPLVLRNSPLGAGRAGGLLLVKFALVFGLSRLFGSMTGRRCAAALWLCAGGEFGFVLLSDIRESALAPPIVVQAVLAALVISMLLAPIIVQHSDRIVMRFAASEWLMRSLQLTTLAARTMREEKHAVICGFGRSGQYLARFMAREGVGYVALDLDPDRVREATAAGEHVVYGNATRREMLIAAGYQARQRAGDHVFRLRAAERVLRAGAQINPALPVVVRTIDDKDFDVLQRAGAAEVVPETLESS
jgi:CPA2 family monovalent cation:H+ antiporter-2